MCLTNGLRYLKTKKFLYENGVLKINLPKREDALPKPKRMISIG